jgi:hypothetical protein
MSVAHKKTRKEKIRADLRHGQYILKTEDLPSVNNGSIEEPKKFETITFKNTHQYSYVLHDTRKTLLLTLSIIFAEIILFFLLKNHFISIPWINY